MKFKHSSVAPAPRGGRHDDAPTSSMHGGLYGRDRSSGTGAPMRSSLRPSSAPRAGRKPAYLTGEDLPRHSNENRPAWGAGGRASTNSMPKRGGGYAPARRSRDAAGMYPPASSLRGSRSGDPYRSPLRDSRERREWDESPRGAPVRGVRSPNRSPHRNSRDFGGMRASSGRGAQYNNLRDSYNDDWELEEAVVDGEMVLLDRRTNMVYDRFAGEYDYPRPLGQIRGEHGKLHRGGQHIDIFAALENAAPNSGEMRNVFRKFDRGGKGYLDRRDIEKLARWLHPQVTSADVAWFQSQLDEGEGAVYEADLQAAIKGARGAYHSARTGDSTVRAVMKRASDYLREHGASAERLFDQLDANASGYLEPQELLRFFQSFLPELTSSEHRQLLAHLHNLDINNDGRISLSEFKRALKRARVKGRRPASASAARHLSPGGRTHDRYGDELRRSRDRYGAGAGASVGGDRYGAGGDRYGGGGGDRYGGGGDRFAPDVDSDWDLEPYSQGGVDYLLDPRTQRVYDRGGGYPSLMGRVDSAGGMVRRGDARDFFAALEELLQVHGMRLKQLFRDADVNGDRRLDRREMKRLVKSIMPAATQRDLDYLQAFIDVDGDGRISYEELRACISEGRLAGQSARGGRGASRDLAALLDRIAPQLRSAKARARELFAQCDTNRNGTLEQGELLRLLKKVVPRLTRAEERLLLAHFRHHDMDGDGKTSFKELCLALGALNPRIRAGGARAAGGRRGEDPYGWRGDPYGRDPYARDPYARDPYARDPYARDPYARDPYARDPYGAPGGGYDPIHGPGPVGGGALPGTGGEWVLTAGEGGALEDPQTGALYELPSGASYPRLTRRGGTAPAAPPSGVFDALSAGAGEGTVEAFLQPAFDSVDRSKAGSLDRREVPLVLLACVPEARAAEAANFEAMVNAAGPGGPVTCKDLAEDVAACIDAAKAAKASPAPELEAALAKVRAYASRGPGPARVFEQVDLDRRGAVDGRDVGRLVKALCPDLSVRERRLVLAHLAAEDARGDGAVKLADLLRGLRMARPVLPPGHGAPAQAPAAQIPHAAAPAAQPYYAPSPAAQPNYAAAPPLPTGAPGAPAPAYDAYGLGAGGMGMGPGGYPPQAGGGYGMVHPAVQGLQSMAEQPTLRERMGKVDAIRALRELALKHPRLHSALQRLERDPNGQLSWESLEEVKQAMASEDYAALLRQTGAPGEPLLNLVERPHEGWGHSQRLARLGEGPGQAPPPAGGPPLGPYGPTSFFEPHGYMRGPYGPHTEGVRFNEPSLGLGGGLGMPGMAAGWAGGAGGMGAPSRRFRWPSPGEQLSPDVFRLLHSYLRHQGARVVDMFQQLDTDRSGALERRELVPLLRRLVPSVTPKDMAYFAGMMDSDMDGRVTLQEFMAATRESYGVCKRLRASRRPPPELVQVLHGVAWVLAADPARIEATWRAEGGGAGHGELDLNQAVRVVARTMPQLGTPNLRLLLAAVSLMDRDLNGRYSFVDFVQAVRAGVSAGMGRGAAAGGGSRSWRRRTAGSAWSDTEVDPWEPRLGDGGGYMDDDDMWGGGGYGSDGYGYGFDSGLRQGRMGPFPPTLGGMGMGMGMGYGMGGADMGMGGIPGMGMGSAAGYYGMGGAMGGMGGMGGADPFGYGALGYHAMGMPGGQLSAGRPLGPGMPGREALHAAAVTDAALKGMDGVYGAEGMGFWDSGMQDAPLLDNYYRWTHLQREKLVERWEKSQKVKFELELSKKKLALDKANLEKDRNAKLLEAQVAADKAAKAADLGVTKLEKIAADTPPPSTPLEVQEQLNARLSKALDKASGIIKHYQQPKLDLYNKMLMQGFDLARLPQSLATMQHQGHQIFWPPIHRDGYGFAPVPKFPNPMAPRVGGAPSHSASRMHSRAGSQNGDPSPPSPPPPSAPVPGTPASASTSSRWGVPPSPPPPSAPPPSGYGGFGRQQDMDGDGIDDNTGMTIQGPPPPLHEVNEVIAMGGPFNGVTPSPAWLAQQGGHPQGYAYPPAGPYGGVAGYPPYGGAAPHTAPPGYGV